MEAAISALKMFGFLAANSKILFLVIRFFVGVLQEYLPPKKIEAILGSKMEKAISYQLLGSITPFCSCSTALSKRSDEGKRWFWSYDGILIC